ncbi:unnamed protein product [Urochloa humidicola]
MARTIIISHLVVALCILSSARAFSSSSSDVDAFIGCLSKAIPCNLVKTPGTNSYSELLMSTARNLRYVLPNITKPLAIVAATEPAHVQATVVCGRRYNVRIRTRSGGHDCEGLSYASIHPGEHFVVLDLAKSSAPSASTPHYPRPGSNPALRSASSTTPLPLRTKRSGSPPATSTPLVLAAT